MFLKTKEIQNKQKVDKGFFFLNREKKLKMQYSKGNIQKMFWELLLSTHFFSLLRLFYIFLLQSEESNIFQLI